MNDYILNQFVGTEEMRPGMLTPGTIGEYTYATDAHSIIRVKSDKLSLKYVTHEKFPKCEGLYTDYERSPLTVSTVGLSLVISKMRYRILGKVCKKCDGDGDIICQCCDSETTCKDCNGTGEDGVMPVFKKVMYYDEDTNFARFKLGERYYTPLQLERILIAARCLGMDQFVIQNDFPDLKAARIELGPFEILMMPVNI